MTTQFTVGKTYSITGYNDTIKVVKRTEKSIWFEYAGETLRKKIHETSCGEKLVLDGGSACIFAVSVIEPQNEVIKPETIEVPEVEESNDEIISLDELDLIHLIQDLTLIELENKKLETLEISTSENLENPKGSTSMNREGLLDRLAVIKMKRYKAFQNNWNTSKYDAEICEITDLLKQLNDREITPSDSDNLNTLEFPQDEILNTLEFPQGSAQDLDKFEVVYQVLCNLDEICYESRKVYATSKDHAKSIVSLDLQAQHLRYIITGVEEALVLEDLSDFSLEGHGEF